MILSGKKLEDILEEYSRNHGNKFPASRQRADAASNCWMHYDTFKDFLEKNIYPDIQVGATVIEKEHGDTVLLTDHGIKHVLTVMQRASELLSMLDGKEEQISPYELFFLMNSILIHDIGNIWGRRYHPQHSTTIAKNLRTQANLDAPEARVVTAIAEAHSGKSSFKEFGTPEITPVFGDKIRALMLAAVLRFADELADDRSRTTITSMSPNDWVTPIPEKSIIHHLYAYCLQSVILEKEEKTVCLHFETTKELLCMKFKKTNGEQFIIDEIFERTLKTYKEMKYCNTKLLPDMRFERVRVNIHIFEPDRLGKEIDHIRYTLEETAYPDQVNSVHKICPELTNWKNSGTALTGQSLYDEYCGNNAGK